MLLGNFNPYTGNLNSQSTKSLAPSKQSFKSGLIKTFKEKEELLILEVWNLHPTREK